MTTATPDGNAASVSELERILGVLEREMEHLVLTYSTYNRLFRHSGDRADLLSRSAGGFFDLVRQICIREIASTVCRLLDSERTGKKENLVLKSLLPHLQPDLQRSTSLALEALEPFMEEMRDYRNWKLSHTDRECAMDPKSDASYSLLFHKVIPRIAALLQPIALTVRGTCPVGLPCLLGGPDTLVARLEIADAQLEGKQVFRDHGYYGPNMWPDSGERGT